jgi:hypothetical protein
MEGSGGLVRILLVGEPHDGHELYMDELDIPEVIYTSPAGVPFQWWPERIHELMTTTAVGGDSAAPPIRYVLRVPEDTREPLFVSDREAR